MTLATIGWLLPIISKVSPATLSVRLAPFIEYVYNRVPRIDFTSANFTSVGSVVVTNSRSQNYWMTGYNGPTPETQRVVKSVAT